MATRKNYPHIYSVHVDIIYMYMYMYMCIIIMQVNIHVHVCTVLRSFQWMYMYMYVRTQNYMYVYPIIHLYSTCMYFFSLEIIWTLYMHVHCTYTYCMQEQLWNLLPLGDLCTMYMYVWNLGGKRNKQQALHFIVYTYMYMCMNMHLSEDDEIDEVSAEYEEQLAELEAEEMEEEEEEEEEEEDTDAKERMRTALTDQCEEETEAITTLQVLHQIWIHMYVQCMYM